MNVPPPPEDLEGQVRAILKAILARATFDGAIELRIQADRVQIVGGPPTLLRFSSDEGPVAVDLGDGPLPIRTDVHAWDDTYIGEVLVWVRAGRLRAMEYAWVTDQRPRSLPSVEQLRIRTPD